MSTACYELYEILSRVHSALSSTLDCSTKIQVNTIVEIFSGLYVVIMSNINALYDRYPQNKS